MKRKTEACERCEGYGYTGYRDLSREFHAENCPECGGTGEKEESNDGDT